MKKKPYKIQFNAQFDDSAPNSGDWFWWTGSEETVYEEPEDDLHKSQAEYLDAKEALETAAFVLHGMQGSNQPGVRIVNTEGSEDEVELVVFLPLRGYGDFSIVYLGLCDVRGQKLRATIFD